MKKWFTVIMLLLLLTLSGCLRNNVVPNEGEVRLYLGEAFQERMSYEEIPSFTFTFEGSFNTIADISLTHYTIFATNDDLLFSQALGQLLNGYSDRMEVEVVSIEKMATTRINTKNDQDELVPLVYDVDQEDVFYETAYIQLENGLKLTVDYRRFVSGGITYFAWRYTHNITMFLYYPLMVVSLNETKELLLLTLPNRIAFQVGPQLRLEQLMSKDDYLQDSKYTFNYRGDQGSIDNEKNYVIDYYTNGYNGTMVEDTLEFIYLNVKYSISFSDTSFTIRFLEKVDE